MSVVTPDFICKTPDPVGIVLVMMGLNPISTDVSITN